MPWVVGLLCLTVCWPLGIPALITTGMARLAAKRSADAVQDDDLHGAARLLGRSRRYRSISLFCSAIGVVAALTIVTLYGLGTTPLG